MAQAQIDGLIKWVREHGGYLHPDVVILYNPELGFHVEVKRTLSGTTRIASCPMPVTISILNATNTPPFKSHGTNFPVSFINQRPSTVIQYFFLMDQYVSQESSWWAPYIRSLPTPVALADEMLSVTDPDDLKWIAGTNLIFALKKRTEDWRKWYEDAVTQLKRLKWNRALEDLYTW